MILVQLTEDDGLTPKQVQFAGMYLGKVVNRKEVMQTLEIGEKTYYRYTEIVRNVLRAKYVDLTDKEE